MEKNREMAANGFGEEQLADCPCCGGLAVEQRGIYWIRPYHIECSRCGLRTAGYNFIREAREAWNSTVVRKKNGKSSKPQVMYLCDGHACENGCLEKKDCHHTVKIQYAKNFQKEYGVFIEREDK